jgi:gluconate kinase
MKKYLVTGVAASGKSSVATELAAQGHHAVDTESAPGISRWFNRRTGQQATYRPGAGSLWIAEHDLLWDGVHIRDLLEDWTHEEIFVCGLAANQQEHLGLFDGIFLLKIDAATMQDRLATRTNDYFGHESSEQTQLLGGLESFQRQYENMGAIIIDGKQSVPRIAHDILRQTQGAN